MLVAMDAIAVGGGAGAGKSFHFAHTQHGHGFFCWIMATAHEATSTTLPTGEPRFFHDEAALPGGGAPNVRHANHAMQCRTEDAAALQSLLASEAAGRQLAAANPTPPSPHVPAIHEAQQPTLGTASGVLDHSNRANGATPPAAGTIPPQPALDGDRQLATAFHNATSPLHGDAADVQCVAHAAAAAAPTGGAAIGANSTATQGPADRDSPPQLSAATNPLLQVRMPPPGLPPPPALLHTACV